MFCKDCDTPKHHLTQYEEPMCPECDMVSAEDYNLSCDLRRKIKTQLVDLQKENDILREIVKAADQIQYFAHSQVISWELLGKAPDMQEWDVDLLIERYKNYIKARKKLEEDDGMYLNG